MDNIPNMPSGKMFPEHSVQTKARTSEPSWRNWQESKKLSFQSLDLTKANGQRQDSSPETIGALLGELWTPSIGVSPQRRLRISLVLDLTGGRAGEILFEPESLRGHFAPGVTPGQAAAGAVENGAGTADRAFTLKIRSGCEGGGKGALVQTEKSATLSTLQDQTLFVAEPPKAYSFDSLASNSMKSSNPHSGCREVEIAKTLDTSPPWTPSKRNQGGIAILDVLPFDTTQITSPQNGSNPRFGDPCHPLAATAHPPAAVCETVFAESIVEPTFCIHGNTIDRADTAGANGTGVKEDVCYTLNTIDRPAVAFALDCRNMTVNEELPATLQAKGNGGQSLNYINPVCYAATTEPNMVICDDCSPAIRSRDYKDPNIVCYDARGNGDGKTSPTITGDYNGRITDYTSVIIGKNHSLDRAASDPYRV